MPIFDLVALKAKLVASALVFEMQLKIVVFPVLVNPMMPQLRAIFEGYLLLSFYGCKGKIIMSLSSI
jgi:hypothetical protein